MIKKHLKIDKPISESDILWVDKYKPRTKCELAVNCKKVDEVQRWIDGARGGDILQLVGPTGCGKSACVNAIGQLSISSWGGGDDVEGLREFVRRVSRYEEINDGCAGGCAATMKRVVVMETIPNQFYEDPSKLHAILASLRLLGKHPLILILSDSPLMRFSPQRLLPKTVQEALGIATVAFNAIAVTQMKKALARIVDRECTARTVKARVTEMLGDLANESHGDIRSAINSLQVLITGLRTGTAATATTETATGKDARLFIFRALGKVLYGKRETDAAAVEAHHARMAAVRPCAREKMRAPLLFNPEAVFEESGLEASTFTEYLHENHLEFIENIDEASAICDSMSLCDRAFGQWRPSGTTTAPSGEFYASVVSRSLVYLNESRPRGCWRSLRKCRRFEVERGAREARREVTELWEALGGAVAVGDVVCMRETLLERLAACGHVRARAMPMGAARALLERLCVLRGVSSLRPESVHETSACEPSGESAVDAFRAPRHRAEQQWTLCSQPNEDNIDISCED